MPTDSKCRTCLCDSNSYYQLTDYIDEKYKILEMLDCVVPQIDVKTTLQFSSLVCHTCVEKLLIGYKFQQLCIETHNRLYETQKKLEQILDPLKAEPKIKMMGEVFDICFEPETLKENFDGEKISSANLFTDDSDSSNEKLSVLKQRTSALNRSKANFPCTKAKQQQQQQHKAKQDGKKQDAHESDLTSIFDEKANRVIEQTSKTVDTRQQGEQTPPIFNDDYENSGDNSEDELFSKSGKGKINNGSEVEKDNLLLHNKIQRNSPSRPENFECPVCQKIFKTRASLSGHRQIHTRNSSECNYPCTKCPRSFTSVRTLIQHITNKHPEAEKYKCDQCNEIFMLHAHLVKHLKRHKGNKNEVCVICQKKFAHKRSLKQHMHTHNNESHLCPQCGKTFRTANNLIQHMERHTALKKYQCPECPSRFKCRSYLTKHAITHSNAKPHVCDICGSRFTRANSMQTHKLLHSGERPFKCEQCNMTFAVFYNLRRHMRTHTGEKPYKCKYCERAYAESGDLTKHLRTHVGENTYKCDQCPDTFKYQAELRQHQSQHYKIAQQALEKE